MNNIWTLGYGLLAGTHEERRVSFQRRLEGIRLGIGKPITLVDIRKEGSGSRNGVWFRQAGGLVSVERSMRYMLRFLDGIDYAAEPALANEWGATQAGLKRYAHELDCAIVSFADTDQLESLQRIFRIAKEGERAVVLLCGCKSAYKANGTSWNCHRVPLGDALVELLGPGWSTIHL